MMPSWSAPARLLVCALCTFATIACAAPAGGDGPAIKKVYVLFSNHLDIGSVTTPRTFSLFIVRNQQLVAAKAARWPYGPLADTLSTTLSSQPAPPDPPPQPPSMPSSPPHHHTTTPPPHHQNHPHPPTTTLDHHHHPAPPRHLQVHAQPQRQHVRRSHQPVFPRALPCGNRDGCDVPGCRRAAVPVDDPGLARVGVPALQHHQGQRRR